MTDGTSTSTSSNQGRAIGHQRQVWDLRARHWAHHVGNNHGLQRVVDTVVGTAMEVSGPRLGTVVDLGAGSGQVILRLAQHADRAVAVDVSPVMLQELEAAAAGAGATVETVVSPVERLRLPDGSVDIVVSNYALHHLRDRDKGPVLAACRRWLRPGGYLVVGDMMLGRGGDAADRAVIASKVRQMAAKGPAGWWRIAKNAFRLVLRVHERPLSASAWARLAKEQGFEDVRVVPVVNEAAVLVARCPATDPSGGPSQSGAVGDRRGS